MVASLVVLGAILIALVTMDLVSARTSARSDALRSINRALRTIERDVRGAFLVAPVDAAHPEAATDGIALLVQRGTTGAARDPRVWVTYECRNGAGSRECTRTTYAAEQCAEGAGGACPAGAYPPMIVAGGRFGRGAELDRQQVVGHLATGPGQARVFELGWPADAAAGGGCANAECLAWGRPVAYGDPRLDPRGFYRRAAGDSRPPVTRVTLQVQPPKAPAPVAMTTALTPRGCVDPAAPNVAADQFEC